MILSLNVRRGHFAGLGLTLSWLFLLIIFLQASYVHSLPASSAPSKIIVNDDERAIASSGTYPRLTRLQDGGILAGYTTRNGNQRILKVARSDDNGKTFSEIGEVTRGVGDVDNLFLLEVSPNTVLAAFRNHDYGSDGSTITYFRITVCQSTDGGRSWKYLSQAYEKTAPWGLWEPFMRIGRGGEVQLYYAQETAADDQLIMEVVSYDQGKTWSAPRVVVDGDGHVRDGMLGIAETFDQDKPALVMVFEAGRGLFSVEAVISYDDGNTWSYRHVIYSPSGHNAGAPQISSFGDGSLAVVFMTDDQASEVNWVNHAAIRAVYGTAPVNGQIQWSEPAEVSPENSFWPGVFALDDQTALAAYDHGGPKVKSLSRP